MKLNRQPIDLAALIQSTATSFGAAAEAQQITIDVKSNEPLPLIRADADRVGQVLRNLIGNALRYAGQPGGRITIETWPLAQAVRVTVRDTGAGLAADEVAHVFDRFYRGDKSRARHSGGSGLGLAIAKSLIEAHGGAIGVESTLGQGSCFWFTLPRATE